jgi:A/G-specific adenine glycosylase
MRRERTAFLATEGRPTPEPAAGAALAEDLCRWFASARRDLPWRRTRDPYAIWVSEIMLQQTRVETVIPYYQRFLARFPDVGSLAAAPLEDVLAAWSGLGYYRRARHLAAGAREVVDRYAGALPADPRALEGLSGIGRYTAGAIASIAFEIQAPLVDGNVARVLSRVFGIEEPVDAPRTVKKLYELAASLVPAERPGDFNQALMELGATICTPAPRCALCPIAKRCAALASGRERELPVSLKKKISPRIELTAALLEEGGRVLLGKRPSSGIFADMWEPPLVEARGSRARTLFAEAGIVLPPRAKAIGEHTHVLTHRVLEVSAVRATGASLGVLEPYVELRLCDRAALAKLPTSTLARTLLAMLGEERPEHGRKRAR